MEDIKACECVERDNKINNGRGEWAITDPEDIFASVSGTTETNRDIGRVYNNPVNSRVVGLSGTTLSGEVRSGEVIITEEQRNRLEDARKEIQKDAIENNRAANFTVRLVTNVDGYQNKLDRIDVSVLTDPNKLPIKVSLNRRPQREMIDTLKDLGILESKFNEYKDRLSA